MASMDRKLKILQAIIDDYTVCCEPIGSRTITRKYDMGVSPATIRNEMSDLEELGYLAQPHVSAGRVPSNKAYRLYVDMLLDGGVSDDDEARAFFAERVNRPEDAAESAAQALSELTRYTSLVLMPGQLTLRISTMQLVPMPHGAALLVIVTDNGIVRDTVIHVSSDLDADALYAISRMLTERFSGKTLQEVQKMLAGFASVMQEDTRVLRGISELISQMRRQAAVDSLSVGGAHNILNYPEYSDVLKARAFLSVMEAKDKLCSVLKSAGSGISVLIGDEIGLPEINECSLVTAQFAIDKTHRGTVGLMGPVRMPYKQVLRVLNTASQMLTGLFNPEE